MEFAEINTEVFSYVVSYLISIMIVANGVPRPPHSTPGLV